ncbi:hypothetical protein ACFCVY_09885 [Streptomyces sp. NPDC056411]|uniref:hypothetical protein n=1 Tax=Streptomyces sp. NPDC056411 TaxID=3345813 RepID=UPI0035DFE9F2
MASRSELPHTVAVVTSGQTIAVPRGRGFKRTTGVSPHTYRRTFRRRPDASGGAGVQTRQRGVA